MSKDRRIIICPSCNQEKPIQARGLCGNCYAVDARRRKKVQKPPCVECGKDIEGARNKYGLCLPCNKKRFHESHKEKHAEQERARRAKNPEHIRELDKKRNQTEKRKKWTREYRPQYYEDNKEKFQEYNRQWMRKHRELFNHYGHVHRARKHGTQISITRYDWDEILKEHDNKCYYCGKGNIKLTRDHKIASALGGGYTKENIVPACNSCNSRKKRLTPEQFQEYVKKYPTPEDREKRKRDVAFRDTVK